MFLDTVEQGFTTYIEITRGVRLVPIAFLKSFQNEFLFQRIRD